MALVHDDDVVEKFSAKASNHVLDTGVLPRRSRRRDGLLDTEAFEPLVNAIAIDPIAVSPWTPTCR